MQDADISGITFTVTAGTGGGGNKFQLSEDDWYPAVLTKVEKFETATQQYGPSLNWTFELQGPEFVYKHDGVEKRSTVRGSTSLIFSSNPARPSKLYTWYCKLTGSTPADGEKVTLAKLFGMKVFVMVKGTAGKDKQGNPTTWYNVEKVKPAEAAVQAQGAAKVQTPPPVKQAKQVLPPANNPGSVTDPSQIAFDVAKNNAIAEAAVVGATPAGDLYKDVF